ncbi:MAG: hypothetical protein ACRDRJ_02280 [Streptosporangiaceae bacterium]
MPPTEPALRQSGRVLVIDPAGRVLLLEGFDPAEPDRRFWFTIGGGLDDVERRTVTGYRWWSHEEVAATAQTFFPSELPDLLRRLAVPEAQPGG